MLVESKKTPAVPLKFERSGKVGGQLLVSCTDKRSYEWLKITGPQIDVGTPVEVIDRSEAPKWIRVGIYMPNNNREMKENLDILQFQNSDLHTSRWSEIVPKTGRKSKDGVHLFWVDPESLAVMETAEFLLHLEYQKIPCWRLGSKGSGAATDSEVDQ